LIVGREVGAVAVRGDERHRRHPAVAVSYGSGLALIVDEFALLLDLKDVYWARQGRISIDIESLLGSDALFGQDDHFWFSPHADPTPLLSSSARQEVPGWVLR
jgi:hypothetical protein